jgi:pimeloyl-ACP methyl ester carboxylesterase
VPEAEQCGWLKDKYGLSWQIVPSSMDEMLGGDDRQRIDRVTQAVLQMKKIDLAKLREAYEGQPGASLSKERKDAPMVEPRTQTLTVPGARLTYDVRDPETRTTAPVLLLIGHPMEATGFATLAGHFRDRTVVTYDPRGVGRSERTDRTQPRTPEVHADDLHRLITALGAGPVDIFASSGGAINALALVTRHPQDVRTLVAHEPPAAPVLPDREEAQAAVKDIRKTYEREGFGPAMAKFIYLTSLKGPIPADFARQPAPSPADFGLPAADDGSRDDPLLGDSFVPITHYVPDYKALQAAPTRIVIAAGIESKGEMAHRAAEAIAAQLRQELVMFPSHHGGFLGGEFGYRGDPDAFAATLRQVLDEEGIRGAARGAEQGFDRTTGAMSRGFDTYDRDFRSDFERTLNRTGGLRSTGHDYERFRPAYQYGYNLATEKRFRGRSWNEVERDARREWEQQHPGEAWQDFKSAVQHAYQRVREDVKDALD